MGPVNPQPPAPGGGMAPAGMPLHQSAGTDLFQQNELFYLAKISDRLETIVLLLVFIMVATITSAVLLIRGR